VLIKTVEVLDANGEVLAHKITLLLLPKFIDNISDYTNARLLLRNSATYCLKAGNILKVLFTKLKHVTCLAHAIHNFAETVRGMSQQ
jgi:hypothetical protein